MVRVTRGSLTRFQRNSNISGPHDSGTGPGDIVEGARVVSATLVPCADGATFDLLPSGPTGTCWANGDSSRQDARSAARR